jgi:propanol-preferring alcohol dehydrogenase
MTRGEQARELARSLGMLSVTTHKYPLDDADRALADLKAGRFDGAAVLVP